MKPLILATTWFCVVVLSATSLCAQIIEIPIAPPGPNRWIVDLTGQVPQDAVDEINKMLTEVFEANNRELVVVVIDSTEGREPRSYGTQLFNQWGVGSAFKDNGILILAALKDRAAEIIIGEGEDYDNQVRMAEKIMDQIILPAFKAGDIGTALYEGTRACATQILGIAHLEAPRNLDLAKQMKDVPRPKPRWRLRREIERWGPTPWFVGLGVLGLGGIFWFRHFNRYRARPCLVCGGKTILLTEEQDDDFLDPPERLEERLGSVDYDVWACLNCDEVCKIRYGKWFTRYSKCPQCHYQTRSKITKTIVPATTINGGVVRVDEDCANCPYHNTYTYTTPPIPKPSSSSSGSKGGWKGGWSSGTGFGSGSSSSSRGSFGGGGRFGGGRSAGRGASGRW
jgi:uncharacterized protein